MMIRNQDEFQEGFFETHVEKLLYGNDVGNGTPASAVVLSALEADRRICGAQGEPHFVGSNEDLMALAFDVLDVLKNPDSRITLPQGTVLETKKLGDIRIGDECWVLDAGRPGLHPMETMCRDAHGPNLELLHLHITRMTRRLACRRLGLPHPVLVWDDDERNHLHFAPLAEAGNVVLQCSGNGTDATRFCGAFPEQIEAFAEDIVEDMRAFWERRRDVARQAVEVRAITNSHVAGTDAKVEAIIVDFSMQAADEDLDFYVHYLDIDVAMRHGRVLGFIPASRRKLVPHPGAPWGVDERRKELTELRRLGADGRITQAASAILCSGHIDVEKALADLSRKYDFSSVIPTARTPTYVTFYWNDGTIRADVTMNGRIDWRRDRLEIIGIDVPEVKLAAMAGRPISDLADLPFGGDIIVEEASSIIGGVKLDLGERMKLINLETGRIWDEPVLEK